MVKLSFRVGNICFFKFNYYKVSSIVMDFIFWVYREGRSFFWVVFSVVVLVISVFCV